MACCGTNDAPSKELNNQFKPNYNYKPLTPKFYARHETDVKIANVAFYERELYKRLKFEPRSFYAVPITTNQIYGWLSDFAFLYTDDIDTRIFKRYRQTSEEVRLIAKCMVLPNTNRR